MVAVKLSRRKTYPCFEEALLKNTCFETPTMNGSMNKTLINFAWITWKIYCNIRNNLSLKM